MKKVSLQPCCPILRAPTECPNHSLHKIHLQDTQGDGLHILRELTTVLTIDCFAPAGQASRGIIFVRYKSVCEQIGKYLMIPHYHGELSPQAKEDTLSNWKSGHSAQWIVATSALQNGLHYDSVMSVVFWGAPYSAIGFRQALGRGGRNGQPCPVYVLWKDKELGSLPDPSADTEGVGAIQCWLKTPPGDCLRSQLSQWFDSITQHCSTLPSSQKCGHCDGFTPFAQHALNALNANPTSALADQIWDQEPPSSLAPPIVPHSQVCIPALLLL